jgi:hypothetical protein
MPSVQLLAYGFGPDADFAGQLVGALERIEDDGKGRVIDALFLRSDPNTGELSAFAMRGGAVGKIVVPALDFRLDAGRRHRATERTLRDGTDGMTGDDVKALAGALAPGSAVAAVLLHGARTESLDDAVSRTGGTLLANRLVDATALTVELLEGLLPG